MDNYSFAFLVASVCMLVLLGHKLSQQMFKHVISYSFIMIAFIAVMGDVYLLESVTNPHLVELGLLALVAAAVVNTVNTLVRKPAE